MPPKPSQIPPSPNAKKPSLINTILVLGIMFLLVLLAWKSLLNGSLLQSSTLNTSFNRLSSTEVMINIPEPGKLTLKAGPSKLLTGATVFAVVMSTDKAAPSGTPTFTVTAPYTTIMNIKNPENPQEMILALSFPEGTFATKETLIAEMPFTTTEAGQFEIKSIYFGSLPTATFPPFQDFPIFIESSNILFDEKGAAKVVVTTNTPPPTGTTACSDTIDNDSDSKVDYPVDPGCESALDNDETDPPGPKAVRLDLPAQFIKTIQAPDGKTETIVILPPAQEQIEYEFTMKAAGGAGQFTFGAKGRTLSANGLYPFENSGLTLSPTGTVTGDPETLKAANYRYPLFVTDGDQTFYFTLQIAVNDVFGNPIGLDIETSFSGSEHRCLIDQICEAFFKAKNGIEPYIYSFSGETPTGAKSFLQVNAGQAFYRFIPTKEQVGSYDMTVGVRDSSKQAGPAKKAVTTKVATIGTATAPATSDTTISTDGTEITPTPAPAPATPPKEEPTSTSNSASIPFTLVISAPPPPEVTGTFKFAADCNFLDVSDVDPDYEAFQFTCRNQIMQGSEGLMKPTDSLNRAEAAKITTLVFSDEEAVKATFKPFQNVPDTTTVNFQDVSVGDWYSSFVYYLFKQGVIVNNLLYRPSDTLSAAEAMKLVIEAYLSINDNLAKDFLDITDYSEWYQPYQTIASYVDASIAYADPGLPATREQIAELIFKLSKTYPVQKFQ